MPRDREKAVALALGQDKALARRLEAMRADRAAMKALPEVSAPPGLLAAVESALQPVLERQMLLGLRDGEPLAAHPPVSIVQPVRRSIAQTFFADRVGRRLAMAAGLLLVVGGATYMGTTYLSGRTAPRLPERIAIKPPEAPGAGPASPASLKTGDSAPSAERRTASKPESAPVVPELVAPETQVARNETPDYDGRAMGPFMPELDGARAAELAREGRLAIRITALDTGIEADPGRLVDRIRHADQNMLRVGEDAPASLAAVLSPSIPEPPMRTGSPARIEPTVAGDQGAAPMPEGMYGPPAPPPDWNPPAPHLIYLVQARLDSAALDTLKSTLSGTYGKADFEELAEPLPDTAPALNNASVVWWNQAPSGWTWWANVPVVIDTNR